MVGFFKKYSSQYGFDYLMVVAQGYQESRLEQFAYRPGGAVGIMQLEPSTAASPPISIPDIFTAENNIHAGARSSKPLRTLISTIQRSIRRTVCYLPSPLTTLDLIALQNSAREHRHKDWIPINGLRMSNCSLPSM